MSGESSVVCDECGRSVAKIWRVYDGCRYCSTCYARVFKRRPCPRCGNPARLPRWLPEAVCSKCAIDKPCIRCGKVKYAVGKITSYGPVCNACSVYFRERHPCDNCGIPSPRLACVLEDGHQRRLCPRCTRIGYGRCQACGRHRQLLRAEDGGSLCQKCTELGDVSCPQCGAAMPAGYGRRCESCYWTELLNKRLLINSAGFSQPSMARHYESFGRWLVSRVGERKAAIIINRYQSFFVAIEREWRDIPSYTDLLHRFGAEQLRRVRLPMTWLSDAKKIIPNAHVREADSERRRIALIMASVPPETLATEALSKYKELLNKKLAVGKTTMRSMRLALRPAASLLLVTSPSGKMLPSQASLDDYLEDVPGQVAAITGFIKLLNQQYDLKLAVKVDAKQSQEKRNRALKMEMVTLVRKGWGDDHLSRKWIAAALAYFHHLPRRVGRSICADQIVADEHGGGMSIRWNEQLYWIPIPVRHSYGTENKC